MNQTFRFDELLDKLHDGSATDAELLQMRAAMKQDPTLLKSYVDQTRMAATLQWRSGRAIQSLPKVPAARERSVIGRIGPAKRWAVAAAIVLCVGGAYFAVQEMTRLPVIGHIAGVDDVRWSDGQRLLKTGDALHAETLRLESGVLHLTSASGAKITVAGPAEVQLDSPMLVLARAGQLTVTVNDTSRGFTVQTAESRIVDQGTIFGVQVAAAGKTELVVFEGKVDLDLQKGGEARQLAAGQGVRVDGDGIARIQSVVRNYASGTWSTESSGNTLISSVRDNTREGRDSKFYQIVRGGLQEDAPAYVDRVHQWNGNDPKGIPAELLGADLVMPFNDDKRVANIQITLTTTAPATLYVLFDSFYTPPRWLVENWTRTEMKIGMDLGTFDRAEATLDRGPGKSIERVFTVWKRDVPMPGEITLHENIAKFMYGIAAKPLQVQSGAVR